MNLQEMGKLDPRIRLYVPPERVVWSTEGKAKPVGLETLTSDNTNCVLKHEGEAPGFIVDFGREIHGGIQITNGMSPGHKPIPVHIRFGESVAEVMGEPNQDHAIHDQEVLIPWYGYAEFGNTGFRFARVDMVNEGDTLEIKQLQAVFVYRDLEYLGTFKCSDDRLNKIWEVGAYTVHLCMQDMLWDGIKRDRLVWIGDMHPETMVINTVFGNHDIVPKSLDYVRDKTPLPSWMNGISSYSLWWVLLHDNWYQYHGNKEYLEEQREYLLGLIDLLIDQIGEDNRERMGDTRFLDWPSSEDKEAVHVGLHALLYMTLKSGAHLCDVLGEGEMAQRAREGAKRMEQYTPPKTNSKQASALLAISGLADPKQINQDVLSVDPLQNISTFYGYYVLEARAAAGDYEGALHVIRDYWGAMLDVGATSFWEHFELDWTKGGCPIDQVVPAGQKSIHADFGAYCFVGLRHSLCHGWAGGPTAWMHQHILGIKPLEPGCTKIEIKPNLIDLDYAEGTFPTIHGLVKVRHEKAADGSIKSEIDAPDQIEVLRS